MAVELSQFFVFEDQNTVATLQRQFLTKAINEERLHKCLMGTKCTQDP